jgi:hypothetical protein
MYADWLYWKDLVKGNEKEIVNQVLIYKVVQLSALKVM